MKLKEKKEKEKGKKWKGEKRKEKKGTRRFFVHAPNCFSIRRNSFNAITPFLVNQKFLQEMMVIDWIRIMLELVKYQWRLSFHYNKFVKDPNWH